MCNSSVVSNSLYSTRLLCPWGFSSQEYWSGSHFLLQGIFLTWGSNPGLQHCRQIPYHLSHEGSPHIYYIEYTMIYKWYLVCWMTSIAAPGIYVYKCDIYNMNYMTVALMLVYIILVYYTLINNNEIICCCSVALRDPMDCSTPGFPVLPHLPELAQTHAY